MSGETSGRVFNPCSDICPALTGKPFGSTQYCQMASPESMARHRGCHDGPNIERLPNREAILASRDHPRELWTEEERAIRRNPRGGHDAQWGWYTWDWRVARWVPGDWVPAPPGEDGTELVQFEPSIPLHPDYTDCCADFRCCADLWEAAGLGDVRDALTSGASTIAIAATDEGPRVIHTPLTTEEA